MRAQMNRGRLAAMATVVLALTWCAAAGAALRDAELGVGGRLHFDTVEKGLYGDWARPTLLAARGPCEWNAAMGELEAQGALIVKPAPLPPAAVNWSRQMIVLVALGNMDGYSVEITRVSRIGGTLILEVHVELGQRSGELDISPYHLVTVDGAAEVDQVVAHYDWAPPGLPTSGPVTSCASTLSLKTGHRAVPEGAAEPALGASGATHAAGATSWGMLKVRYR